MGPDFCSDQAKFTRSIDRFHFDGYKQLPGVIPAEDLLKARDVLAVYRDTAVIEDVRSVEFMGRNPVVRSWIEMFLGGVARIYYGHLLIVAPGESPPTSNWHIDNRPPDGTMGVKAHFYLTDVDTVESGPPWVMPGSVWMPQKPVGDGIPLLSKAGDVLLSRPDMWHRSSPNHSPKLRKSVHLSFCRV